MLGEHRISFFDIVIAKTRVNGFLLKLHQLMVKMDQQFGYNINVSICRRRFIHLRG